MQFELALVQAGVISAEDYVEAATRRDQERTPLGQLAIEEGALTVRQVLDVLHEQAASPGKRFGDVAIQRGYLDNARLAALLLSQQERQRPLLAHLVELGRVSAEAASQPIYEAAEPAAAVAT